MEENDKQLKISYVAFQPHLVITNPELLGRSLILRIPEYVRDPLEKKGRCPGHVVWEEIEHTTRLRYRWAAPGPAKAAVGVDFRGEARASADEVVFQVTMKQIAEKANPDGVSLFCLQAGGCPQFHDYEGERTFIRQGGGWKPIHEMIGGKFEPHRMCSFEVNPATPNERQTTAGLMGKVSKQGDFVLGIALDACGAVSCNHQIWPSCIHANPRWSALAQGVEQTVRGKVYYFKGSLEELDARYERDFGNS